MALFGRRVDAAGPRTVGFASGPGRRLSSSLGIEAAVETVRGALLDMATAKYEHMGVLFPARIAWHGDAPAPAEAYVGEVAGDLYLLTFAADESGTLIGLFALDSSEVPASPLIGQVKQRDVSLSSTGTFPARNATLQPPALTPTYLADLLKVADAPVSMANETTLVRDLVDMFNTKAWQFIADTDRSGADRFVDRHQWSGDPALPDQILHDLGAWNPGVIPYIQDLPWRVRGLLLERADDGSLPAAVWAQMDRTPARLVAPTVPSPAAPPAVSRRAVPPRAPVATARPAAAASTPSADGYRCSNPVCAKRGELLSARQCPACFHYAQTPGSR